jgi:hypothetical protein
MLEKTTSQELHNLYPSPYIIMLCGVSFYDHQSPSHFLMKPPLYDFSCAALQDWNDVSCRLMVKLFVHWIANIWTCTTEGEILKVNLRVSQS